MHCWIAGPAPLRFSKLILTSHKPALRVGNSAASAGIAPTKVRKATAPISRMIFFLRLPTSSDSSCPELPHRSQQRHPQKRRRRALHSGSCSVALKASFSVQRGPLAGLFRGGGPAVRNQHGVDALRHLTDRNGLDEFHARNVDHRHGTLPGVGDVEILAIRRKRRAISDRRDRHAVTVYLDASQ